MTKEIIKNSKAYIAIIIVLLIYLIFTFIFFRKDKTEDTLKPYLVTDNSKYIYTEKNTLEKIEETNDYNWKDYNIYVDNEYIGNYKLQYNNKWYIYNNERDSIKYEGKIIAASNMNIKVYDYEKKSITQEEQYKINNYLERNNIDLVEYDLADSKVEIDLDNDNEIEKIYRINSKINNNPENIFSIILLEKNNKIETIASKIVPKNTNEKIELFDIYGFLDIDNDEKKEILINRMIYSQPESSCEIVYKIKNKKYEKITEC